MYNPGIPRIFQIDIPTWKELSTSTWHNITTNTKNFIIEKQTLDKQAKTPKVNITSRLRTKKMLRHSLKGYKLDHRGTHRRILSKQWGGDYNRRLFVESVAMAIKIFSYAI